MMFDYKKCFDDYCSAHNLALHLSFSMPVGYETANGNFDPACKTVFINAKRLKNESDSTKAFFLFHELRHALQSTNCAMRYSTSAQINSVLRFSAASSTSFYMMALVIS